VARWIGLNRDVIVEFWNREADGIELGQRPRRAPGSQP
jgi:hypothetical protein